MDKFKSELEKRLTQTPDFFTNTQLFWGRRNRRVRRHAGHRRPGVVHARPRHADCSVLGGSTEQREAAVQAGLGLFQDSPSRRAQPEAPQPETRQEPPLPPPTKQPELPGLDAATDEDASGKGAADSGTEASPPDNLPAAPALRPTMVIDKPVRTGQRIYAKDANLVVLAIVNAGAELIADGDIHIYAPLRGRAIAAHKATRTRASSCTS